MTASFKVAVIGEGEIAERFAQAYKRELPKGGKVIIASGHEALNEDGIKAVEVCLPQGMRAQVMRGALEAGKHVSALSPISDNTATIAALNALARSKRLVMRSFQLSDYHKSFRVGAGMVSAQEIGELQMVRVRWLSSKPWETISLDGVSLPPFGAYSLALSFGGRVKAVYSNPGDRASAVMLKYEAPGRFGIIDASYAQDLQIPGSWHESIQVEATGIDGVIWANGYSPSLTDEPPLMMHRGKETTALDAGLRLTADHAFRAAAREMIKAPSLSKRKLKAFAKNNDIEAPALAIAAKQSAELGNEVDVKYPL